MNKIYCKIYFGGLKLEEERNISKPMCQTCPHMKHGMCMHPCVMFQLQMMGKMSYSTQRDEDDDFLGRQHGHGGGGGHFGHGDGHFGGYGHGHYGHYYGGYPYYPYYDYYPYYPYPYPYYPY
jgi:hypothetical protein